MKAIRLTLLALLGIAGAAGLRAADTPPSVPVSVIFSQPEKFTDAARDTRGSDFGLQENLDEIQRYLIQRATPLIPDGDRLTITFTDIDLAGEYEPWRTPGRGGDTRIVKDIYTPKMDLTYRLADSTDHVIKEGKRHLTNLNFMMDILPPTLRSEPLAYDKQLVGDWLRTEFGGLKKKN